MRKYKSYLIYDRHCPFCVNVAFFLKHFIEIDNLVLIPNSHTKRIIKLSSKLTYKKICKDVHLVEECQGSPCIFSGADAVARVLSMKKQLNFIWSIHLRFPFIFKLIYYIAKKIRVFILKYTD